MSPLPLKRIVAAGVMILGGLVARGEDAPFNPPPITVPEGFEVEVVAAPPLVGHPMMACFDERGRLFIAESAGTNMNIDDLEKARPNFIRMIEDTDGDGKFDKSTIFANNLVIPNGVLWYRGALYVAEPPGIWRFTDTNGDGVADKREHIAARVRSNGMSSTLHGPVLGPTGRLFWCGGQMGYTLDEKADLPEHRIAPGVFTLRPDGSEDEIFAVGGMANPVEVTFSPEGEVFGTVAILDYPDGARHDALMHWVYGGTYHLDPGDPQPLKRTGEYLPPMSHVGQVAPAGCMTYRGDQFGGEYRNNIFWAQFNTHKIVRTEITRAGGTFKSKDTDFLVADSVDFHPTDVLEDADGSLLVVDTGGWFRWGCPTSQIAKPDVKGAIYRIRKKGGPSLGDPRGLQSQWAGAKPEDLVERLGDARPAVQDRAIDELALMSNSAVGALSNAMRQPRRTEMQRNAVWALSRMHTSQADDALCDALNSKDTSVQQAAICAVGMERVRQARNALMSLVQTSPQESIRREAATALGRLGAGRAVPALLSALRKEKDPFLQHALIYALIQIDDGALTTKGLADKDPLTRRGALLALSQMDHVQLSRDQVTPMLKADDLELRKAAFLVTLKHPDWNADVVAAAHGWVGEAALDDDHANFLRTVLLAEAENPAMQQVVADVLTGNEISKPMRLLLMEAIKQASLKQCPDMWLTALEREIQQGDLEERLAAISVARERNIGKFDESLNKLAHDQGQPVRLRIAALATLAPRLSPVDADLFGLLGSQLKPEIAPIEQLAAARTFASLHLSDAQLVRLADSLPQSNPLVLPTLLRAFNHSTNDAPGLALMAALLKTRAAAGLSPNEVARLAKTYSPAVQAAAKPLLEKLGADLDKQQAHLAELSPLLEGGDISRGKAIFFGKKATCSTCHRISGQGGLVGPNLSQVGKIRAGRDILESIVYPSASIVQGFQPFNVQTTDDQAHTGIIIRQTPEAIWVRGTDLAENKIETGRIKSMTESPISIMPQGLADLLSKDELRDLLAYLESQK